MKFSTFTQELDYLECFVSSPEGYQVARLRVNNPAEKTHTIFPVSTYVALRYTTQSTITASYTCKWKPTNSNVLQEYTSVIITDSNVLPTLPDTEISRSYTNILVNGSYNLSATVTFLYYRFPDPLPPVPPVPPVPDEDEDEGSYVIQINGLGQSVITHRGQFYGRFVGSLYRSNR